MAQVESIRIEDAGKSGAAKCPHYRFGGLLKGQRGELLQLVGYGASLGEILVVIFHKWLGLGELRVSKLLGLPLNRVAELRASASARLSSISRRRRKEHRIARKAAEEGGSFRRCVCHGCKCRFILRPYDDPICPDCLEPIQGIARGARKKRSPAAEEG